MNKSMFMSLVVVASVFLTGCGGGKIGEKENADYVKINVDSLLARPESYVGKTIEMEFTYLNKKVYRKKGTAIWAVKDSYDIDILVTKDQPIYDLFTVNDIENDDSITVYGKPYLYKNSGNIYIIPDEIVY
ncbi:hypothetical protein [Vibrio vulnificus]|uniref:hypothetical protein n=1 Tax=Vibrio vulnificus TaxID=672 RepID=UPI00102BE813|nr:hypothetical protein [Vibrio vulnificus]RZR44783.1 hypothetical protein D8T58_14925 [Vibrio vulnificus]